MRQRLFGSLMIAVVFCLGAYPAHAQCNNPSPARPILFVHGIWGDSSGWGDPANSNSLRGSVISRLLSAPGSGYSNRDNYDLYFDGSNVKVSRGDPNTDPVASTSNIPCEARFFSIRFYSWAIPSVAFDPLLVAQNSIITKSYELSQVIKTITRLTFVKDVIVVAHSMGALDTRAYIEGLGSTNAPCTPASQPCRLAGSLKYTDDIGHVITIDGANAGSGVFGSSWKVLLGLAGVNVLNIEELQTNSMLIQTLNYQTSYSGVNAQPLPLNVGIDAIISYYAPGFTTLCTLSPSLCGSDNVLTTDSQSKSH
ncbi:MAG: hypothetical protein HY232_12425 [Acidobacteria bacterium]|nr:hypothetical protein [Acidobacteriota bacterium]